MDRKIKIILYLSIINCILLVLAFIFFLLPGLIFSGDSSMVYPERIRNSISALEARGLYDAELNELDRFRTRLGVGTDEEADLLYKMGKLADEKLGDCDRALAYYTMATSLNPEAGWANDAGRATVVCMEKVGRKKQAQALLYQLTGEKPPPLEPDKKAAYADSPIVAMIGERKITWDEVVQYMAAGAEKDRFQDPAEKNKIVQGYIFETILYEEAIKKGYDTDPEFKKMMERTRRMSMATRYAKHELEDPQDPEQSKKLWEELMALREVKLFPFPETKDD